MLDDGNRVADSLKTSEAPGRRRLSRRVFLQLSVAAAALAACDRVPGSTALTAPEAGASPLPTVSGALAKPKAAFSSATWLAANRLMFGPRTGDLARIEQMGLDGFVERQLAYEQLDAGPAELRIDAVDGLREMLTADPASIIDTRKREILQSLTQATLLRAVYSDQQLYELMVDFWTNHFNIFFGKNTDGYLKTADDRDVIRPYALGKFRDLLDASAHSPAMMVYLDNNTNVAGRPNENYARELMELHTLGVNGGYTQDDVQAVARAFTGWGLVGPKSNRDGAGQFRFRAAQHDNDVKRVFGQDLPAGGGVHDAERVLDMLAKHPSTAAFISLKLARRFVADEPPASVVQIGAAAFAKSDGDIRATLGAILHSAEFKASSGGKLKRPFEFVVSALRAAGADSDCGRPVIQGLRTMGQPLFAWASPNGYPDVRGAWAGASLMLGRWNAALALCANTVKGTQIDVSSLVGGARDPVDALARQFLGATLPDSVGAIVQPMANPQSLPTLAAVMLASPLFQVRG